MELIQEIMEQLRYDAAVSSSFRYYFVDGAGAYFQNVKSISSFSENEVSLCVAGGEVKIRGKGLFIRKYFEGDAIVDGKITDIEKIIRSV